MLNELQKTLKNMAFVSLMNPNSDVIDESYIDNQINQICGLPMFSKLSSDEIDEVKNSIKSECSIKLNCGALIEEQHHEKWFKELKAQLNMSYWDRYKQYLQIDKSFSPTIINVMDDILDTITDLLGNPNRDCSYKRRGLIIGDVQSGKTANYTGLICKAVDAGYKVVVLLTGMIEKLRQQTQNRIDEGFVGRNSDAIIKQQDNNIDIGVGRYNKDIHPVCLTSTSDDFKQKNANNLNFDLRNINGAVIFVVKKNSSVLKGLNKWLKTFNQNGDNPIDNSILVIDDEADNASVNTKKEENPTVINSQIRELLKNFTKSSYVGFTATPFANIFIDPDNFNEMVEADLFPKDYVYSLNSPSNYIGARNIFGEDGDSSYMLATIDDNITNPESIENILPLKHKETAIVEKIPDDMKTAIATFFLSNVIQDVDELRNRKNTHRSMLINVSRFTSVQGQVSSLVNNYVKDLQNSCRLYSNLPKEKALNDKFIKRLYDAYLTIYKHIDGIDWECIQRNLYSSCASISVITVNKDNKNSLNYHNYKNGLRVIAVGGMSLSRGLTLEGLVVSYFYRNSTMYDTLMQMGRWFGYRTGYEDLCKIWMSEESQEWYRHISDATDELRDEIRRHQDSDLTPKDFGLRVRSDINTLLVTSRNKMRSTEKRECVISLSGETIETPEILADSNKNQNNIKATREMIDDVNSLGIPVSNGGSSSTPKYGYKNVPASVILDFLEKIEVSPKNEAFNTATIRRFIADYNGYELKKWDIAFASGEAEGDPVNILGEKYTFRNPRRRISIENDGKILKMNGTKRRLGTSSDGRFGLSEDDLQKARDIATARAEIKAKEIGKQRQKPVNPKQEDYFSRGIVRNPLLTIYFITLSELCKDQTKENQDIFDKCKSNLYVGFGIGIPTLTDNQTKYARYVLNKVALQNLYGEEVYNDSYDEDDDDYEAID